MCPTNLMVDQLIQCAKMGERWNGEWLLSFLLTKRWLGMERIIHRVQAIHTDKCSSWLLSRTGMRRQMVLTYCIAVSKATDGEGLGRCRFFRFLTSCINLSC